MRVIMTDNKPKEPEPQVDRVGKFIKRQKGPWVLDVDYGVLKDTEESPRPLADCSCCGNRNKLSHVDKSRRLYCGDCIDKLSGDEKKIIANDLPIDEALLEAAENMGVSKVVEEPRAQIAAEEARRSISNIHLEAAAKNHLPCPEADPISNQIDLTVIIAGKVYDLVPRNETCMHADQKFADAMKDKKSNFCQDCGKIMNYRREKKLVKPERKEKKNVRKAKG